MYFIDKFKKEGTMPKLIDIDELASYLRLRKQTIYNWLHQGKISGINAMADDWTMGGVDGDFVLVIPEGMAFRLDARTMDGDVEVDGVTGMNVLKKKRNRLVAERGNATHTINFSTVDGDLKVKQQ